MKSAAEISSHAATGERTEPEPFRLSYRPELDGVRGIAISLVMVHHLEPDRFLVGGFLGVDIFFVLSGFLITSLLAAEWAKTGAISLRRFYARRALRLLPALELSRFAAARDRSLTAELLL